MDNRIVQWKEQIAQRLAQKGRMKALIGFDGYVDELVKVVEGRSCANTRTFYANISDFARRIEAAAGKSADIEIVTSTVKLGGNGPIMANALASLGADTVCIGAMGEPKLHSVFQDMAENCRCISVCSPASTCAFEFNDGKLMFGNLETLNRLSWSMIKEKVGMEQLVRLFGEAELIALVNWSGVLRSPEIWKGILEEIMPRIPAMPRQIFFDLADPSGKAPEDIAEVIRLIGAFGEYGDVTLGLNENEALCVFRAMGGKAGCSLEEAGQALYRQLGIKAVVIHPIDRCIAVTKKGVQQEQGQLVKEPKVSTGGGDNFNAGLCMGLMLGLETGDAMQLGMAVSRLYVQSGASPSMDELQSCLTHSYTHRE